MSCAVGAFNIGTGAAGTTVAVTGLGFTPRAIVFWWSGRTAAGSGSQTSLHGMGFATATQFYAVSNRDEDALGTSATRRGNRNDACILELTGSTYAGWADVQSMDSDGFTLEILDAFDTDLRVHYFALSTIALSHAFVGWDNQISFTGVGFQPDLTMLLSNQGGSSIATSVHARQTFGAARSSAAADQATIASLAFNGAATGDSASFGRSGIFYAALSSTTAAPAVQVSLVSHDSDGFTASTINIPTGFLCLKFAAGWDAKVGELLTRTDGNAIAVSGMGFTPSGVLFASVCRTEQGVADVPPVHDEWSIGAATSASSRVAQNASSRDGNTDMFTMTAVNEAAVYVNMDPTTDAVEGVMDIQSFDSDGFTAVMDDPDPAASWIWYIAFGEEGFTLGPPTWAIDSWAVNIWAENSWDVAGGSEPIAGSDTLAPGITDATSTLNVSVAPADTLASGVTDAASSLIVSVAPSDTPTVGVTDTAAVLAENAVADTIAPGISEGATEVTVVVTADDTAAPGITDAVSSLVVAVEPSDTILPAITDAVLSLVVSVEPTDTLTLGFTDTATVVVIVAANDTLVPGITEGAADVTAIVTGSDTLAPSITDTAEIIVYVAVTDTPTVGWSEAVTITAIVGVSDSLTVGVTDAVLELLVLLLVSESAALSIQDDVFALASMSDVSDTLALVIDEDSTIDAGEPFKEVSETFALVLEESVSIVVTVAPTDTLVVGLTDVTQQLAVVLVAADTVSVGVGESLSTQALLDASDALTPVVVDEVPVSIQVVLSAADVCSLGVTEATVIDVFITVTDVISFAIVETSDVLPITPTDYFAEDTLAVSVVDTASVFALILDWSAPTIERIRGGTIEVVMRSSSIQFIPPERP